MATTTPVDNPPSSSTRARSTSRTRLPSRPTTPLRPPSRTSLRASQTTPSTTHPEFPLAALEPAFAELSDSMADLEANFMHLQLLHEILGRFNENFGAFLYGLNMSAFCVDFPEAPIAQSFARAREGQASPVKTPGGGGSGVDAEATFLTNDTSFVENPPTSGRGASKFATPRAVRERQTIGPARGGVGRGRGVGASGIGRGVPSTRGGAAAGASRGASGIGRGLPRGRGVVR